MYLYGYRSVIERLKNQNSKNGLLYITQKKLLEENKKQTIISMYKNIKIVTNDDLYNICKNNQHNSVCLEIEYLFKSVSLDNLSNNIIMLNNVTDVGNLGSIIRSAAINKYDLIISRNGSAPINEITAKNAAGALEHIKIHICGSELQTIQYLKKQYYFTIGATEKSLSTISRVDFLSLDYNKRPNKVVLIMGGENQGIAPSIIKELDFVITIPADNNFNVYNVSVAAALCMFLIKINNK